MDETVILVLAGLEGGALGALFFGGLWWTVRLGIAAKYPALWFLGSLLVRMSVTLVGFYFISDHHWQRLLVCMLGFVVARLIINLLTRATDQSAQLPRKASNAS